MFALYDHTHAHRLPVKAHLSRATIKQLCLCWPADCFILNHPIIRPNTLTQTQTQHRLQRSCDTDTSWVIVSVIME